MTAPRSSDATLPAPLPQPADLLAPETGLRLTVEGSGADGPSGSVSERFVARDQAVERRQTKTGAASAERVRRGGNDRAGADRARRTNDAERTRANILDIAFQEFAEKGFTGARIDEIADRTHTSKNMIYYYFGSKEKLYRQVLENSYRDIRRVEHGLHLPDLPVLEALRELVGSTFDFHIANPDFVRLVMVENIAQGVHIRDMPSLKALNTGAIDICKDICKRGVKEGVIRKDIVPTALHMTISSLCFYNVSNRHTFSVIYNVDMVSAEALKARRAAIIDIIMRYVRPD